MKKILVMSDSHGRKLNMQQIMEKHEDVYAIAYLGDGESDLEECELYYPHMFSRAVVWVKGNCDWFSVRPVDESLHVGGHDILFTHGHYYDVKNGLTQLEIAASKGGYDIAVFGHTHTPYFSQDNPAKPTLFNPGAVADGHYGLIKIYDEDEKESLPARVEFELRSL